MRRVVIGLGSNLGDRAGTIAAAIERLAESPGVRVVAASPLYESEPAGGPPQGDYLNAAVLLETALSGREILERALTIERSLGRVRPAPVAWGPRTIDLDLLWIEGEVIADPDLDVPHPRLHERPFALRPLLDVAPDAVDPRSGAPFAEMKAAAAPLRRAAEPVIKEAK